MDKGDNQTSKKSSDHCVANHIFVEIYDSLSKAVPFAEGKSGGLIVLNVAIISFVCNAEILTGFLWMQVLSVIPFAISLIIGLLSFTPLGSLKALDDKKILGQYDSPDNMLFFGNIAKLDAMAFISKIDVRYSLNIGKEDIPKLFLDYATQITDIAKIVVRKHCFYKLAQRITIIAIVGVCAFLVIA